MTAQRFPEIERFIVVMRDGSTVTIHVPEYSRDVSATVSIDRGEIPLDELPLDERLEQYAQGYLTPKFEAPVITFTASAKIRTDEGAKVEVVRPEAVHDQESGGEKRS